MRDLVIAFDEKSQSFDLVVDGSEIQAEQNLKTLIALSLFTDKQCEDYELPLSEISRRGFWGDALDGFSTGSKLWTIMREKESKEVLQKATNYCQEALKWLSEEKLVKSIKVECYFNKQRLIIDIYFSIDKDYKEDKYSFSLKKD